MIKIELLQLRNVKYTVAGGAVNNTV